QPAGTRRPFHTEDVAANLIRINITFKSPGVNNLAALLLNGSQLNKRSTRLNTKLLLKFALRSRQRFFAWCDFSFRNRPRPGVLISPERTSRVDQEEFHFVRSGAIH